MISRREIIISALSEAEGENLLSPVLPEQLHSSCLSESAMTFVHPLSLM